MSGIIYDSVLVLKDFNHIQLVLLREVLSSFAPAALNTFYLSYSPHPSVSVALPHHSF